MENVKEYVENFATFGDPVEYKGLKIKPILACDALEFMKAIEVFQIEKNKIPSVEIIRMSYLQFILSLMIHTEDFSNFLWILEKTLGLSYREDLRKEGWEEPNAILLQEMPNGDAFYYINGWDLEMKLSHCGGAEITIAGVHLTASEFNDYKDIVLFQNIYDYDDTVLSDDVRRVVEQYYALKNKGIRIPTLEDKAAAIILNTSYTYETLKTVPLRSFEKLFHDSVSKVDYIATKSLEPHLKEGQSIDHWIYKPIREKYSEVFRDAGELTRKITSI